jgi:hypothetical protein
MDATARRAVLLRAGLTAAIALTPPVLVALLLSVEIFLKLMSHVPEAPYVALPLVVPLVVPIAFWRWSRSPRTVGRLLDTAAAAAVSTLLLMSLVFVVTVSIVVKFGL